MLWRPKKDLSRIAGGHGAVLITRLDYSLAGAGPRTEDGAGNQLETLGGLASAQSSPASRPHIGNTEVDITNIRSGTRDSCSCHLPVALYYYQILHLYFLQSFIF